MQAKRKITQQSMRMGCPLNKGIMNSLVDYRSNKTMRHERKYLLNKDTAFLLKQRISYVLQPDSNNIGGKYRISSIYFDDRHSTAVFEKQNGLLHREKIRIRSYNGSLDTVNLEFKQKHGELVYKEHEKLSAEQYAMMRKGDYSFIKELSSPLLTKFYAMHLRKSLNPVVIVDYERQAYMHPSGDVRITFDSDMTASLPSKRHSFSALPEKNVVMEIKYTGFLPSLVNDLFSGFQLTQQLAISKFLMARQVLQGKHLNIHRYYGEDLYQ